MFEVDGIYENRKGKYTVLSIEQRKMHVRYEDGTYADLNIEIQSRIWQNILSEQEAAKAKAYRSAQVMLRSGISTRYFIKSISLPAPDEMLFPGWHEQVVMTLNPILATRIKMGDRLI